MTDWNALCADEVRKAGRKVDEIHTTRSVYGVYLYCEYLVQIHEEDSELAAVWKDGRIVWLHPRALAGLERLQK